MSGEKKIRLDMETLEVSSFHADPAGVDPRGTVRGHVSEASCDDTCEEYCGGFETGHVTCNPDACCWKTGNPCQAAPLSNTGGADC